MNSYKLISKPVIFVVVYACRYEPVWKTGPFHFWPAQIKITDCVAVRSEIPF
jgi:hypothetical protein